MFELDLVRSEGSPSASERGLAPFVDVCNRIALRARPWTIQNPAHRNGGLPPSQLQPRVATCNERSLSARSHAANRDVTGQGSQARRYRLVDATPLDAIARFESFAPPR